jgi:hypothetical protein
MIVEGAGGWKCRGGEMTAVPVSPRVHALVVCDEIEFTDEEEVYSLFGVRPYIQAEAFPYTHPQLCVYIQATGHEGVAVARVAVIATGSEDELFSSSEQAIQFDGPLRVLVINWRLVDCTFPAPGVYYVQVYFGPRLANERLLILSEGVVTNNGDGTT